MGVLQSLRLVVTQRRRHGGSPKYTTMVIFSPTGLSLTSDNYQEKGGVESKYETMDFVAALN